MGAQDEDVIYGDFDIEDLSIPNEDSTQETKEEGEEEVKDESTEESKDESTDDTKDESKEDEASSEDEDAKETKDPSAEESIEEIDDSLDELDKLLGEIENESSNESKPNDVTMDKALSLIKSLQKKVGDLTLDKAETERFGDNAGMDSSTIIFSEYIDKARKGDAEAKSKILGLIKQDLGVDMQDTKEIVFSNSISGNSNSNASALAGDDGFDPMSIG